MSMIFAYTLHRHLFHLSLCIQRALGLPQVSWWGLAGIPVSTILLQQLNPPGPSCCLRLPPLCPADTGIAKFPWGGHFWQGAGMKPLLGSPWLSGCYLSPNSCWSNAGWEEWPARTEAVATTCPKLDPAGSHEVPMEEIEGLIPRRVSATTLSLETALSSFLYLNPFGLGINKFTKH